MLPAAADDLQGLECRIDGSWRSRSCAYPRMAFIGVRISCDMLARNALLARFAASAASLADTSAASAFLRSLRSRAATSTRRCSGSRGPAETSTGNVAPLLRLPSASNSTQSPSSTRGRRRAAWSAAEEGVSRSDSLIPVRLSDLDTPSSAALQAARLRPLVEDGDWGSSRPRGGAGAGRRSRSKSPRGPSTRATPRAVAARDLSGAEERRGRARIGQGGRGAGEPREERVPREHVATRSARR